MNTNERIVRYLTESGVKVARTADRSALGGNDGGTDWTEHGPVILLAEDAPVSALVHEAAHVMLGHKHTAGDDYHADVADTEAEAVTQIICGNQPDPRFTGAIDADKALGVILILQDVIAGGPV